MFSKTPRIAICFFGITRAIEHTVPSIEQRIFKPARRAGEVRVYAHLFQQDTIVNPRSGEQGQLDPDAHKMLPTDWIELEKPDICLTANNYDALQAFGDFWDDDFKSVRNLIHQLHSLNTVTMQVLADGYDVVIFARPDLKYHDSIWYALHKAMRSPGPAVWLPSWQSWMGVNDRFAICKGRAAIEAYGQRGTAAVAFCEAHQSPLHSEQLLAWRLEKAGVALHDIDVCASRIRIDGSSAPKDVFPSALRRFAVRWARRLGVKPLIRWFLEKAGLR